MYQVHVKSTASWLKQGGPRLMSALRLVVSPAPPSSSPNDTGVRRLLSTTPDKDESYEVKEDPTAFKAARPFDSLPSPGGVYDLPHVGFLLLFKPFGKLPIQGLGHVMKDLHPKLGPIFRVRLGKEWIVFTESMEDTSLVLRAERAAPYRDPLPVLEVYKQRTKEPFSTLGTLNGDEWRRLRSHMNELMNRPTSVLQYVPAQEGVAADFAHKLHQMQDHPPDVITEVFFRFAVESIGVVCFNKRMGFLEEALELDPSKRKLLDCFVDNIRSIAESIFQKHFMYRIYEDSFYNRFKYSFETSYEYTKQSVQQAREEIAKQQRDGTFNPDEPNFLNDLLTNKALSDNDVYGIIMGVLSSGSDSTACGLQLLFYNLATNPDKQQRLADEVLALLGPHGHLTPEALAKMPYLKASIYESLRVFYPVMWGPQRRLPFNAVLSGYQVPGKTLVAPSTLSVTMSREHFDQPHSFIPERWLRDEHGQRPRPIHAFANLPFGYGPRNCIGRRFALQELYLATAKVVQNYHIGLRDCPPLETLFSPFRYPVNPLPFTFTMRI